MQLVLDYARPIPTDHALDLYCGVGLFSLALAPHVSQVTGIDSANSAIEDAQYNASRNECTNAKFIRGDALRIMKGLNPKQPPTLVVMDPPRSGLHPLIIKRLLVIKPKRMIYVSCNPATLARDSKLIVNHGYTLTQVQPLDMFPQTDHVECVAQFQLD